MIEVQLHRLNEVALIVDEIQPSPAFDLSPDCSHQFSEALDRPLRPESRGARLWNVSQKSHVHGESAGRNCYGPVAMTHAIYDSQCPGLALSMTRVYLSEDKNRQDRSSPLVLRPLLGKRLFRSDDNYRIDVAVPVIFGGGVPRIVQPYTIYQELVGVLAGC